MVEEKDKTEMHVGNQPISRKEALCKAGKYAAFTAAAMMTILDPLQAKAPKSPPKPPRGGAPAPKAPKRTDPPPSF